MQPGKSPLAGVRSRRGSVRNGSNDSPIQYDELRIGRDQGAVEIVVYNRAILLFTTDSTEDERSLLPPHHGEAHRVIPVLLPLRLQSDPAVVNKTFAHLDER